MTSVASRLVGTPGTEVALLSDVGHVEWAWLLEGVLSTANKLGTETWNIEYRPSVTVMINGAEHDADDYHRLQLPSGRELLMLIIDFPYKEDGEPEVTRYALLVVEREMRDDGRPIWVIPEGASLVIVSSTENDSLEPFFSRPDLEQLQLLGVR